MNTTQFIIVLTYTLPMAGFSYLFIRYYSPQWLKLLVLASLPIFYSIHYFAITDLGGWPSKQPLPHDFVLLAHQIAEPNAKTGKEGYIRIWAQEIGLQRSRMHELTYSRALHQKLIKAKQRQAEGKQQVGSLRKGNDGDAGTSLSNGDSLEFRDTKRQRPPSKSISDS